jgi:hypothetical protein
METRKITVIETKSSKKTIIETAATTLGELKRDFSAHNIDYSDMTFFEGLTKTELINNDSILPTNVMYKGTPTNNLTIMLTNSNKKIKSGALSETTPRSVVYSHIQNMGLQTQCVTRYGRNYTQVPTASLIALINDANKNTEKKCECNNETERLVNAFTALIDALEFNDSISYLEANELREMLGAPKSTPKDKEIYSQEELDDMFDFVEKN